jgi:hypothetical protein
MARRTFVFGRHVATSPAPCRRRRNGQLVRRQHRRNLLAAARRASRSPSQRKTRLRCPEQTGSQHVQADGTQVSASGATLLGLATLDSLQQLTAEYDTVEGPGPHRCHGRVGRCGCRACRAWPAGPAAKCTPHARLPHEGRVLSCRNGTCRCPPAGAPRRALGADRSGLGGRVMWRPVQAPGPAPRRRRTRQAQPLPLTGVACST